MSNKGWWAQANISYIPDFPALYTVWKMENRVKKFPKGNGKRRKQKKGKSLDKPIIRSNQVVRGAPQMLQWFDKSTS